MTYNQNNGLKRIYYAFFNSMAGLASAWKNETAFRQELILSLILIPCAFYVGENSFQICLLIFSVLIVLITELLNSGIEAAIDRISNEPHELSKRAKDMGSAAVFISLSALAVVWGFAIYIKFF